MKSYMAPAQMRSPSRVPRPVYAAVDRGIVRRQSQEAVQAKLAVSQPGDVYEQEADRVAGQLMSALDVASAPETHHPLHVQRKCASCSQEEELLQTKALPGQPAAETADIEGAIASVRGGGEPLPYAVRRQFEPRLGADFSGIRVHRDQHAASIARAINARAFTVGRDVVFADREYAPETESGRHLLAHELVHTLQQGAATQMSVDGPGKEVDVLQRSSPSIQRLGNMSKVPPGLGCPIPSGPAVGVIESVLFGNRVTSLDPLQAAQIDNFVLNWHATGANARVRIDGFASQAGADEMNWQLSCERAEAVINELTHPSDGSPGIPSSYLEFFAQGETTEFGSDDQNRRVTLAQSAAPRPPGSTPAGCTAITAVPGRPVPTPIGTRGGCASGPDFASHDFPTVTLPVSHTPSLPLLRGRSDFLLEASMHSELRGFAGTLGTSMASHFDGGSGSTLAHGVGGTLSLAVDGAPTFNTLARATEASVQAQIAAQVAASCHIDWTALNVLPTPGALPAASFSVRAGDTLQLNAVLGGTQGLDIFIRDFLFDPLTRSFSATLIFEICDDFGVDETDLDITNIGHGSPGLTAFWILQHERPPGHVAFVNDVTVERGISGVV